jgi:GH25 family lysozyme M1 (1,4-beta-N-acetylmuramidase)
VEKILPYSRDQITQDTGWFCGPATAQTIIQSRTGQWVPEQSLADQMGTSVNGTDHIGLVAAALQARIGGGWTTVTMAQDPPTADQVETLWGNLTGSVDGGVGVACNIVVPPGNYPRPSYTSTEALHYGGGTVFHYIALMGYAVADDGGRHVWIADSGFSPYGSWVTLEQMATMIPPKGYTFAADWQSTDQDATSPAAPAQPAAPGGTLYGIDVSEFQDGLNLSGTGMDFVIIRLAYGASRPDDCAVSHTEDWATTGKPMSFYHYLTPWDDLGAQADLVRSQWDACGRRGGVWIDVEEPGITRAQVMGFRDALRSRGVLVIGSYSRANFWENLPGGEPSSEEGGGAIWVSHYGDQPTGPIRQAYPGDGGAPWSYPLGDRKPDLWQFTDRVTVPGWSAGVDGNAFRGTQDDLRALFTGGTAAPTPSEEDDMSASAEKKIDLILDQLAGPERTPDGLPTFTGWFDGKTVVEDIKQIKADVAEIKKQIGERR